MMLGRDTPQVTWYEFACQYVDMKWPMPSPITTARGSAEALIDVTPVMITADMDDETAAAVRSALLNWGFNTRRRGSPQQPAKVTERLTWVARNCRPLDDWRAPR